MSGIDRSDQLLSYYSCPRKSIRWYKKVICHLLDIAVWNSFYLYRIKNRKTAFHQFREELITSLFQLPPDLKGEFLLSRPPTPSSKPSTPTAIRRRSDDVDDKDDESVDGSYFSHYLEYILKPRNWKRPSYFLLCVYCKKNNAKKK